MRDDRPQPRRINPPVWPLPRSLATTSGISVDVSSSPYLDVSVQAVPRVRLFDSTHADRVLLCRVSPFGNPRINGHLHLPVAYRSLSRPSSAPDAKAFPLRSFQLDLLVAKSIPLRFRRQPCGFWRKLRSIPLLLAFIENLRIFDEFGERGMLDYDECSLR